MYLRTYVNEEGGDGEGSDSESLSLMSYKLRLVRQSRGLSQQIPVWVVKTDTPMYIRDRVGGGRGGYGFRSVL